MSNLVVSRVGGWALTSGFEDGEPRVRDIDLALALEYKNVTDIRQLLEKHRAEVESYGILPWIKEESQKRGRPARCSYLNEAQSLLVSMLSGAPRAPEVRRSLIEAYQERKRQSFRSEFLEARLLDFDKRRAWERLWTEEVVGEICKLYRWPTTNANGGMYAPLASVMEKVYRTLLGDETVNRMQELNPHPRHGRNHHQLLQEKVREMVGTDVQLLVTFARQSGGPREWWRKLQSHFRREPYQLEMH
jgi:hypothetical protein